MTLITNTAKNPYNIPNGKLTGLTATSTDATSKKETQPSATTGDRVTLSKAVANARTRKAMGLSPTGRLKLDDFKTAAENQEEIVTSMVTSLMKTLGVDGDQKISLSLNAKNKISITEDFPQKTKMENALNADKKLSLTFNHSTFGFKNYSQTFFFRTNRHFEGQFA